MAIKTTTGDVQGELLKRLEEIEEDESLDLTTKEGRDRYARRMSEIQAALELMQRVLLKQGLEGGFIDETTQVLEEIRQMEPTPNMGMVPAWFVDVRTGNPAVFIFPTSPNDALGEGNVQDVYTPNGLWYSKAQVYHISAILARVFPLPNYVKGDIVPTPVWQVYDCAWVARLNSQALHLYRFDESVPFGKPSRAEIPAPTVESLPATKGKGKKKGKGVAVPEATSIVESGVAASPKTLKSILAEKYTPEKYFEDIKVSVDAFKCNEVFFLLQTLQVRYVAVFSQLVKRIYGEQLLREMTIAAALEEYLNMRKGFGESVSDGILTKLSDNVLIVLLIGLFGLGAIFLWMAMNNADTNGTSIIIEGIKMLGSIVKTKVLGFIGGM